MATISKSKYLARHTTLNPNLQVKEYKFDCWPQGIVPDVFWIIAKSMRDLWNELVDKYENVRSRDNKDLDEDSRNKLYDELNVENLRSIARKHKGTLHSNYYYTVVDRFIVAYRKWQINPNKHGAPRRKYNLDFVSLPIILNPGKSADWLSDPSSKAYLRFIPEDERKMIRDLDPNSYMNNGRFDIGVRNLNQSSIKLHVAYHRPLPNDCIVKRVTLLNRATPPFGRKWAITVLVQHPPITDLRKVNRVAAIDFGWRSMKDGIRIGIITTSSGEVIECLLPWSFAQSSDRRQAKMLESYNIENHCITDWREIPKWRAKEVQLINACKRDLSALSPLPNWPLVVCDLHNKISSLGTRGLTAMLKALREADIQDSIREILEQWNRSSYEMRRWVRGGELKAIRVRDDHYRKISAWIANSFDQVIWESKPEFVVDFRKATRRRERIIIINDTSKELARRTKSDFMLEASQRWRKVASLSKLRTYIKQSLQKLGKDAPKEVKKVNRECLDCGVPIFPNHELFVECEHGHKFDQDKVVSKLLLRKYGELSVIPNSSLNIPIDLQKYLHISV